MRAMRTRAFEFLRTPAVPLTGVLLVGLAIIVLAYSTKTGSGSQRYIAVDSSYPSFTLADIAARADAVAIVEFSGTKRVFWNSSDNKEWEPAIASGKQAWIYRDDEFQVVKVLRGSVPTSSLTIRGVGGTVADVTLKLEGQVEWVAGKSYLVFLRQDETPFREGSERAWTVVWTGHGALEARDGGRWSNVLGTLSLVESDLAALQ